MEGMPHHEVGNHTILHPESPHEIQENSAEHAPSGKEREVLRPDDLLRKRIYRKIKNITAATVVGVAGLASSSALANKNTDMVAKQVFTGIANAQLPGQPVAVGVDKNGKFGVGIKSPEQIALEQKRIEIEKAKNLKPEEEKGVIDYARDTLGLLIDKKGMLIIISDKDRAQKPVTISSYYHDNSYSRSIKIEKDAAVIKAGGQGIVITMNFIINGVNKIEVLTFTKQENGDVVAKSSTS